MVGLPLFQVDPHEQGQTGEGNNVDCTVDNPGSDVPVAQFHPCLDLCDFLPCLKTRRTACRFTSSRWRVSGSKYAAFVTLLYGMTAV